MVFAQEEPDDSVDRHREHLNFFESLAATVANAAFVADPAAVFVAPAADPAATHLDVAPSVAGVVVGDERPLPPVDAVLLLPVAVCAGLLPPADVAAPVAADV